MALFGKLVKYVVKKGMKLVPNFIGRTSDVEYLSNLEHTPSPGWISCRQAVDMVKKLSNTAMLAS